jgi:ribosome biogenesis GTPase A
MAKADKSVVKQFNSLKQHLKTENPVLVEAVAGFEKLDTVAYRTGVLNTNESFAMQIPWWPLVSVLGVFSAGKSSFINSYLGRTLQKTGNQAVDDKFTVICYGKEKAGQVLPGLALDADMRFPFYRISKEIEQVSSGEGRRIDAYLQLKVTDAEILRGKILIDSPGFDADDQRTATLQLTNHIIDISDLVLVFFDARHPEPGAMQDTLTHLVGNTIDRADSNKFLYILNQIDTAAREDNTEEITGAWQRALAQKGLTAGRFYTIYNKEAAQAFADDATQKRFETKRDADMAEIHTRINQIESERAYRIIGSMESEAYAIRDQFVPSITRLKKLWAKRVLRFDLIVLALLLVCVLGVALATGTLGPLFALVLGMISNPMAMIGVLAGVVIVGLGVHFAIRHAVATYMIRKMQYTDDSAYISAFKKNTRFFRSLFRSTPVGWNKKSKITVDNVLEESSDFVQRLNDQFTNPSG